MWSRERREALSGLECTFSIILVDNYTLLYTIVDSEAIVLFRRQIPNESVCSTVCVLLRRPAAKAVCGIWMGYGLFSNIRAPRISMLD
jgi:hypothetical protein